MTGREEFLRDVVDAAQSAHVERVLRIDAKSNSKKLGVFIAAFEAGLFSLQDILDLIVSPYLKIAKRASLSQKKVELSGKEPKLLSEKEMLISLLRDWDTALVNILKGSYRLDSQGVARLHPEISTENRTKVVRGMMATNFAQVM